MGATTSGLTWWSARSWPSAIYPNTSAAVAGYAQEGHEAEEAAPAKTHLVLRRGWLAAAAR